MLFTEHPKAHDIDEPVIGVTKVGSPREAAEFSESAAAPPHLEPFVPSGHRRPQFWRNPTTAVRC